MTAPDWTKDEQSLEDAKNYLRQGNTVDFFETIASAVLREHPTDLVKYCHSIVVDIRQGRLPKAEGEFQPKKEEDNRYMRAHNVSEFLDRWILALLAVRPGGDGDRLDFHQKYLEKLMEEAK